jgi:hypothetical protein
MRELWIWYDNEFGGALNLNSTVCTNLESVQSWYDHFTSLDVSGQTNLKELWLGSPWATSTSLEMTNLIVSGCSNLVDVRADYMGLSQPAVDGVLLSLA